MSKENKEINTEESNKEINNKNQEKPEYPDLTLDILVGVRQLLALAIQRDTYNEEEMKTIGGVFNYFGASVEGLVETFKKNNPEAVEKMIQNFNAQKDQSEKTSLETINEEKQIPENIKNGCDGDDIQG